MSQRGWYLVGCVFTRAFGGYVFRRVWLSFVNSLYDDGVGVVVPYLSPLHVRPCEVKSVQSPLRANTAAHKLATRVGLVLHVSGLC
jgi:hypothetical protein